jgi:glycosyltransferase involved in cell wall biosynthesis
LAGRAVILNENESIPWDTRVWQECKALSQEGWEVHVICPQGEGAESSREAVAEGVHIHRYPLRPAVDGALDYLREYALAVLHTARLVRRLGRFDVVHASNPPDLMFLVAIMLKRRGAHFIFDQHDLVPELYLSRFGRGRDLLYQVARLLEHLTFRAADVVIATNESYREVAVARGGKQPGRVFVVRNAPVAGRLQPGPADPVLRRGKPHLLCYLGTMGPQDGVEYAVRALAELRGTFGRDDWHAAFIGSGDRLDALRALVGELGLSSFVTFTGRIPDDELSAYLSTADVCLAPDPKNALNDVSSMTKIIEYMTLGRAIVSFDLCESRRTAQDAAVYATPNSERDFAQRVAHLLDHPKLRVEMGRVGQQRAAGPLSWERSRSQLLDAYAAVSEPVNLR